MSADAPHTPASEASSKVAGLEHWLAPRPALPLPAVETEVTLGTPRAGSVYQPTTVNFLVRAPPGLGFIHSFFLSLSCNQGSVGATLYVCL